MMMTLAQGAAAGRESATLVAGLSRIAIGRSEVGLGRDARVTDIATSAAAPINVLPGNPAALKKALETGGKSLVTGLGNWPSRGRAPGWTEWTT